MAILARYAGKGLNKKWNTIWSSCSATKTDTLTCHLQPRAAWSGFRCWFPPAIKLHQRNNTLKRSIESLTDMGGFHCPVVQHPFPSCSRSNEGLESLLGWPLEDRTITPAQINHSQLFSGVVQTSCWRPACSSHHQQQYIIYTPPKSTGWHQITVLTHSLSHTHTHTTGIMAT